MKVLKEKRKSPIRKSSLQALASVSASENSHCGTSKEWVFRSFKALQDGELSKATFNLSVQNMSEELGANFKTALVDGLCNEPQMNLHLVTLEDSTEGGLSRLTLTQVKASCVFYDTGSEQFVFQLFEHQMFIGYTISLCFDEVLPNFLLSGEEESFAPWFEDYKNLKAFRKQMEEDYAKFATKVQAMKSVNLSQEFPQGFCCAEIKKDYPQEYKAVSSKPLAYCWASRDLLFCFKGRNVLFPIATDTFNYYDGKNKFMSARKTSTMLRRATSWVHDNKKVTINFKDVKGDTTIDACAFAYSSMGCKQDGGCVLLTSPTRLISFCMTYNDFAEKKLEIRDEDETEIGR